MEKLFVCFQVSYELKIEKLFVLGVIYVVNMHKSRCQLKEIHQRLALIEMVDDSMS